MFSLKDLRGGFGLNASDMLALGSAASFGLHTFLARRVGVRVGSLKMNAYSFLAGSIVMIPSMIFFRIPFFALDPADIPAVLYLSIFVTGLAYLMYFKGLAVVGAGRGSLVYFVKPVLAAVLAYGVLGESLSASAILGAVLILCGIAVSTYRPA